MHIRKNKMLGSGEGKIQIIIIGQMLLDSFFLFLAVFHHPWQIHRRAFTLGVVIDADTRISKGLPLKLMRMTEES